MTLKTDHSFHIGEQHLRNGKPNQDYALSGQLSDELSYAIVSDGCSSGGMTDVGARLVALATRHALLKYGVDSKDPIETINTARNEYLKSYAETFGLEIRDLLATSMWMIAGKEWFLASVTGDGYVVVRYEHDHFIHRFDWHKNTPYYPAYAVGDLNESFRSLMADNPTPLTYVEEGLAGIGMGGCREGSLRKLSVDEGMGGYHVGGQQPDSKTYPGKIQSIGLFSDGLEQIDGIPYDEAAVSLMAFKSTSGQFATRRMNRFMQETKKSGRGPLDDIAMAVIHLGQNTET